MGAVAAIVAVVLSAIQLLPALEAASEASRATGVSVRDILAAALPSLLGVIGPGWTPTWEDRAGGGFDAPSGGWANVRPAMLAQPTHVNQGNLAMHSSPGAQRAPRSSPTRRAHPT